MRLITFNDYSREFLKASDKGMVLNFIKDSTVYLPAQIAPAIMGLIIIPIITHLFPPGDYGNYVLVMSTVNILVIITGWLSMSIIRFYPAYESDSKIVEFYSTIITLLFVSVAALCAIFLVFLFIFKSYFSSQLWHLMLIGSAAFSVMSVFQVLQQFFRAKRQVTHYTAFQIWYAVAPLGIGIGLIICFHYDIEGLLWGYMLGSGIALPLLWKMTQGINVSYKVKKIMTSLAKHMAKYGFPLVGGNLAAWILSLSDRYILGLFCGTQEVGIYSVSYAISEHSILLLASLFHVAARPLLVNIWEKQGAEKSQEFITKITRYYLMISLPSAAGLSILAKPVIGILTASKYHEGYQIFPFVAFGAVFFGLQQRFQDGLILGKESMHIMTAIVVSGLLNLALNFLLVPKYGYMAAALTTLVSYAFLLMMMIIISRKYFVWHFPFKSLWKSAVASAVMGAIVFPVGNSLTSSALANLTLAIIVGILVYFVTLFFLRELKTEEIKILYKFTIGGMAR